MSTKIKNTELLRSLSRKYGFTSVGISQAEFLEDEADKLELWLNKGNQASMSYLEQHFDKRLDPRLLVPGAKSVISFLYNYYPENDALSTGKYKIARYAYGRDYHKVIKKKLKRLMAEWSESVGQIEGRCFVDSAPVMERAWAARGGLGWRGKNTLLLNKKQGSYFMLAEIICDIDLEFDNATADHCGTCTKCIDACPTEAIDAQGYILDANKCISYLTIERKEALPKAYQEQMQDWMFGCDICQEVCPWNKFSSPHAEADFEPKEALSEMQEKDWEEITAEVFEHIFYGSPVKRTKYEGLKRNIQFLSKKVD